MLLLGHLAQNQVNLNLIYKSDAYVSFSFNISPLDAQHICYIYILFFLWYEKTVGAFRKLSKKYPVLM